NLNYNGHCYEYVVTPVRTYDDASEYCHASNGYLVSINDEAESNFVNTIISGTSFILIGLKQKNPNENIYETWDDGSPIEFTRWGGGQPDHPSTECIVLYEPEDRKWHDTFCDAAQFICESRPGSMLDGPYYLNPNSDNSSYIGVQNTNQLWLSSQMATWQALYIQIPGITQQNNSAVSLISDDRTGNMVHVTGLTVSLQNLADHTSNANFKQETTFL
ncbi:unnamed protein product, partial [Owenia fusiformis]